MKLTEINIYPITSMGGMPLKEATVLPAGLQYDRRWLLLDGNGNFFTQRNLPEMAKVKFEWQENGFNVKYPEENYGSINIPFEKPDTTIFTTQIWNDKVAAQAMPDDINVWFSEIFKQKCQAIGLLRL